MHNAAKGFSAILGLALVFTLLADEADAQLRSRRDVIRGSYSARIQSYPGGTYRGSTTIRSISHDHNHHGPSYTTVYRTNRAPSYRYSTGHPLSQTSVYSRSPYPRSNYHTHTAPTVMRYGQSYHHTPIYSPRYTRPGITIGIRF